MEKKTSPTQVTYSESVSLFRDDLEEIIKILTDKCERVTIEDNEYKYNSLDELFEKRGPTPRRLSITGFEPFVGLNIKIKRAQTTLESFGDGDHLAPFYFIHALLEKRRRFIHLIAITSPLFLLMFAHLLFSIRYGQQLSKVLSFTIFMTLLASIYTLLFVHRTGAFSVISLKKQYEQDSFWTRNKDTIWVALIGALVGGLVTWLVTYLASK